MVGLNITDPKKTTTVYFNNNLFLISHTYSMQRAGQRMKGMEMVPPSIVR